MSIEVKNLTKLYGAQKALDNISFSIKKNEIVGFIGPNGAGKTTTMKILTGLIPQSSGEVKINGTDVSENLINTKKLIGYLPENNPLYLEMYIKEYLEYVAGIYQLGKNTSVQIEKMIHQTGLKPEINKKIGALSKGFRQRVGLAQALIHDPEILILDEPTSGLDPNQIIEIRNFIAEASVNKTVILSTHIMQEVEAICSRVIIINKGTIVANNSTENLLSGSGDSFSTVIVEFDKDIIQSDLNKIKGVTKTMKLKNNHWLLQSNISIDIRPEIFNWAVKNNLTVLSMQKQEKKLEETFQELTRKK